MNSAIRNSFPEKILIFDIVPFLLLDISGPLHCLIDFCPFAFREGSNLTPAHHYSDFKFKAYAPVAFRYFRDLFGIQPDDFLVSPLFLSSLAWNQLPVSHGAPWLYNLQTGR